MRITTQQFGAMDQSRPRYALTNKDEATGLDHTWFRKYENASGRWTSPDPLAGNAAYPQSLNAYTYGNNDPVNLTDPSGLEPALCIVDGFVTNCNTAGMFVNAGIGVRAPLTTTRFQPDPSGGPGETQFLRFVGQNLGWYNSEGHTITAMAWLKGDGVYNFAGGATWKVSFDNPYDPVNVIQAGLLDRWPPQWPPPGDNFEWPKPTSPPTVRPPVMENPNLDNAKNRVGARPNIQDEMNKVKPARPGGGGWKAFVEFLDLFKWGGGGCLVPPVVWTPEMECAVLRKCGIQN
jgi:RHS repeat-associated protein